MLCTLCTLGTSRSTRGCAVSAMSVFGSQICKQICSKLDSFARQAWRGKKLKGHYGSYVLQGKIARWILSNHTGELQDLLAAASTMLGLVL